MGRGLLWAPTSLCLLLLPVHAKLQCDSLTGYKRIVQLYAGHWDAVSMVSFAANPSSIHSRALQDAVACGGPLVLNQYGLAKPFKCDGWFSPQKGCEGEAQSTYASTGTLHAWRRFDVAPRSKVFAFERPTNMSAVEWIPNQHDSPTLRPADVVVYNLEGASSPESFMEHLEVQMPEVTHAIIVYGDVCAEDSEVRKALFALNTNEHKVVTLYCHEEDTDGDDGVLILRKESRIEFHGALARFESTLGAPKSIRGDELFTASADSNQAGVIYKVPEGCTHRLTTNPLQRLFWEDDDRKVLASEPHTGVEPKYLDRLNFRSVKIAQPASFRHTFYSGIYCGATVFTVAAVTTGQKLFYTIATPIVSAIADFGIPTLFRYDNVQFRPRVPLLSMYFHYELPKATFRERRFLAYQLEYGPNKVKDKHNLQFLQKAVVPMEYTQDQLQQWRDRGVPEVQQLPLCYHPSIEYVLPTTPVPTSNALFPGIINGKPRREEILEDLKSHGVKVNFRSYLRGGDMAPKYGVEDVVDAMNSEMLLNFHAYADSGAAQLEVPRLTPYLSNGIFTISEQGVEEEQKRKLSSALVFVPDGVLRMNHTLVTAWTGEENAEKREKVAKKAKEVMKSEFACMKHKAFLASMDAIARNAYPAWYQQSFYARNGKL